MTDEQRIIHSLEHSNDSFIKCIRTAERLAKIEVLEGLRDTMESEVLSCCGIGIYVDNMIRLLKAGN